MQLLPACQRLFKLRLDGWIEQLRMEREVLAMVAEVPLTLSTDQVLEKTMPRMMAIWSALLIGALCIVLIAAYDTERVAEHARSQAPRVTLADL